MCVTHTTNDCQPYISAAPEVVISTTYRRASNDKDVKSTIAVISVVFHWHIADLVQGRTSLEILQSSTKPSVYRCTHVHMGVLTYRWPDTALQHFHCYCTGDTEVLHQATNTILHMYTLAHTCTLMHVLVIQRLVTPKDTVHTQKKDFTLFHVSNDLTIG